MENHHVEPRTKHPDHPGHLRGRQWQTSGVLGREEQPEAGGMLMGDPVDVLRGELVEDGSELRQRVELTVSPRKAGGGGHIGEEDIEIDERGLASSSCACDGEVRREERGPYAATRPVHGDDPSRAGALLVRRATRSACVSSEGLTLVGPQVEASSARSKG